MWTDAAPRRPRPPSAPRIRTHLGTVAAAVLLGLALVLSGCGGGSDRTTGPTTTAAAVTTTTTTTVDEIDLEARRFWTGDEQGSLFEAELTSAALERSGDGGRAVIGGSATNLLRAAAPFRPVGELRIGTDRYRLRSPERPAVEPGATGAFELVADDVPVGRSLADATVVIGAPGTEQSTIPLSSTAPVSSTAPSLDVVGRPRASGSLPSDGKLALTGSALYPRYGTDRLGQMRLRLYFDLDVAAGGAVHGLYLHPSLTGPDGTVQSIGDQNVFPPGQALAETAILTEPLAGTYTVTFLEVATGSTATFEFQLP